MGPLNPVTIEPKDSMFYPTHANSIRDLRSFWKKLNCFDYEKMKEMELKPDQIEI